MGQAGSDAQPASPSRGFQCLPRGGQLGQEMGTRDRRLDFTQEEEAKTEHRKLRE